MSTTVNRLTIGFGTLFPTDQCFIFGSVVGAIEVELKSTCHHNSWACKNKPGSTPV